MRLSVYSVFRYDENRYLPETYEPRRARTSNRLDQEDTERKASSRWLDHLIVVVVA